jgi:P27 family predicted phage terminase small subunit
LKGGAHVEWKRIAPQLFRAGLLTNVDVSALAVYCAAYARWQDAEEALARQREQDDFTCGLLIKTTNGNVIQNPLVGIANRAALLVRLLGSEFGLTPASRTRIESVPSVPDDGTGYFR